MIGWVHGRLLAKHPPQLLLDVRGVGYEMEAPMTTFYTLPEVGEEVSLFAHQLVREAAEQLYAFATERERNLFRMLLRVNGVGAKLALTILSGMDAAAFARCVSEGDTASLAKLPGIGRKTAERLVVEMRDRLDDAPIAAAADYPSGPGTLGPPADPVREAVGALISLGLKPQEASRRVQAISCEGLACEEIVRRALQTLVR